MKKFLKRLAIGVAVFLVLGTATVAVAVVVRENRTFAAPYPDIHASTDPAVIARGRYLVTGPAYCGRAAKALLIKPRGPTKPIRAHVMPGPTVEYGEYLANSVANCGGCHTKSNRRTGAAEGVSFAGGSTLESRTSPGTKLVTPNLTPDPKTGQIYKWSEDQFVDRFKNAVPTASPMPWDNSKNISEDDLRALYRYLRSLPPAKHGQEL